MPGWCRGHGAREEEEHLLEGSLVGGSRRFALGRVLIQLQPLARPSTFTEVPGGPAADHPRVRLLQLCTPFSSGTDWGGGSSWLCPACFLGIRLNWGSGRDCWGQVRLAPCRGVEGPAVSRVSLGQAGLRQTRNSGSWGEAGPPRASVSPPGRWSHASGRGRGSWEQALHGQGSNAGHLSALAHRELQQGSLGPSLPWWGWRGRSGSPLEASPTPDR